MSVYKLEVLNINNSIFESIKHMDEIGSEYWFARELQLVLGYKRWDKFRGVINQARIACKSSKNNELDHFSQVGKMVRIGSKTKRQLLDYKLYSGYRGLYNGETADDIAKRKGLRYREDILDNMCSDELATNLFRISQTEQKIRNDNVSGENKANSVHYDIGRNIRDVIIKNGGVLPEKLPTPKRSLKELSKKN